MNVGSVSMSHGTVPTQSVQQSPEATEVKKSGRDNDGDSDDSGAKAVKSPPAPTVNMNGQTIGQIITVAA